MLPTPDTRPPTYYDSAQELAGLAFLEIGPTVVRLYMPTRREGTPPPPLSALVKCHHRKFWESLRAGGPWTLHIDRLAVWLVDASGAGGLMLPSNQFVRLPTPDSRPPTRLEVYTSRRGRTRLALHLPLTIRGI